MNDLVECKKCGELCYVDGEFPKFFAWCDECNDYADVEEYTADWYASRIDEAHDKSKYEEMK